MEPGRPQYEEESTVGDQVIRIGYGVVGGECCEIGNEEQIEEELDSVRFVALGEDEMIVVGTCKRILDPGHSLVQALEVLFLVTVGLTCG